MKKYSIKYIARTPFMLQGGRHFFGLASIALGITTLIWHKINALGGLSHPEFLVYMVGIAEMTGGLAVQWKRTLRPGAVLLITVFSVFSLYWIPQIIKTPLEFSPYGNFFEVFSILLGSIFIFESVVRGQKKKTTKVERAAYLGYGISVITYALYQLFFLKYTASLVPKWIPPGQMFWAVATTVAFALAAAAILFGWWALPASVWLTTMLILFGLLIWVPACVINPHVMSNWTEGVNTFSMAASAWIVAGYIVRKSRPQQVSRL